MDYYRILGIESDATKAAIQSAVTARLRDIQSRASGADRLVRREAESEMKLVLEVRKVLMGEVGRGADDVTRSLPDGPTSESSLGERGVRIVDTPERPRKRTRCVLRCQETEAVYYLCMEQDPDRDWTFTGTYIPEGRDKSNRDLGASREIDVRIRDLTDYQCPFCDNGGLIMCGQCDRISCGQPHGEFRCPWCGNEGEISGTFDDLKGIESGVASAARRDKPSLPPKMGEGGSTDISLE